MEQIIDEVCGYIKNFFLMRNGVHRGTFTVTNGNIDCDFLLENQYFRVVGSVFNDGVWKYPSADMESETFSGEIWAMGVPPAFIALCSEIEEWQEKYGGVSSVNMSPFSSESFNNYSYSKRSGSGGASGSGGGDSPMTWMDAFRTKLTRWRKI